MSRILLVEDDASLGSTLSSRLEKEGYKVFWARSQAEALELAKNTTFDLGILDVGLPDGSGFDLARELRVLQPVPFVFVTAQSQAEDRLRGYEIGAEEFIPKPFLLKELFLRVRHVLDNHAARKIHRVADVEIDLLSRWVHRQGVGREDLAVKEVEVLRLLLDRSPAVVSRDEILDRVWGEEKFPSQRTVDNVILRLRQVLGEKASACIRTVRGVGYQWIDGGGDNGQ